MSTAYLAMTFDTDRARGADAARLARLAVAARRCCETLSERVVARVARTIRLAGR